MQGTHSPKASREESGRQGRRAGQQGGEYWAEMPQMCAAGGRRWSLVIGPLFWRILIDGGCRLAAEVVVPNLKEGNPKLLDAEGIDDGIHGRVTMCEEDGDVHEEPRLMAGRAEEGDAVKDV